MVSLMTNAVAIVNSRMHIGKKRQVCDYLSGLSIPYSETRCAGDAVRMAQNTDATVIIVAGGDGSVNEVLNGMNVDKQKLLIVPAGTLNSMSHSVGNTSIDYVFTHLDRMTEVNADYLECVFCQSDGTRIQRRVLGFVACGYDGRIVKYTSVMKYVFPTLRYILAGWIAFLVNRPFKTGCVVNNVRLEKNVTNVMINNCGAEMFSSIKKYSIDDHAFEIKLVNLPYVLQMIYVLLCKAGYNGGYQRVSSAGLDWKRPIPVMADGELFDNVVSIAVTVKSGVKLMCTGQR